MANKSPNKEIEPFIKKSDDKNQNQEIEAVVMKCVEDIWVKYDDDSNGYLDTNETMQFVKDTLSNMSDEDALDDADLDEFFKEFNKTDHGAFVKD